MDARVITVPLPRHNRTRRSVGYPPASAKSTLAFRIFPPHTHAQTFGSFENFAAGLWARWVSQPPPLRVTYINHGYYITVGPRVDTLVFVGLFVWPAYLAVFLAALARSDQPVFTWTYGRTCDRFSILFLINNKNRQRAPPGARPWIEV